MFQESGCTFLNAKEDALTSTGDFTTTTIFRLIDLTRDWFVSDRSNALLFSDSFITSFIALALHQKTLYLLHREHLVVSVTLSWIEQDKHSQQQAEQERENRERSDRKYPQSDSMLPVYSVYFCQRTPHNNMHFSNVSPCYAHNRCFFVVNVHEQGRMMNTHLKAMNTSLQLLSVYREGMWEERVWG